MCGIHGAFGCGLRNEQALKALRTLAHRGPDGEGSFHDEARDGFLGHRRLSIIDLSETGRQPMFHLDGKLVLTFNGEIYNHVALRAELEKLGHVFASTCDAEVILHLFEEHGIDLLARLHGMFAFALWDLRDDTVWLARDRLGIKPLYYYHQGERFVFASELKAVRATPGLDLELDPTAFWDFLTYQNVPAPKTIYKRARKLPPGHYLSFRRGEVTVRRYWDVSFEPDEDLTGEAALDTFEKLLREVVADHLVADVPVGAFLSGGLDSTIVTCVASRLVDAPLETFTIRFSDSPEDEAGLAARNAQRLGLRAHERRFDVDALLKRLPLGPVLFDEPFGDHSFMPTLALSELARETMKVTLSGDGGDETHLGYGRYFKRGKRAVANALADAVPFGSSLVGATPLRRISLLRTVFEGDLGRTCHAYGGITRRSKELLVGGVSRELEDYDDYWLYREHDKPELSDFGRQQYMDLKTSLPDGILTKVDRASMRVGLEVRPPLLDHRLVEFAARLPDRAKHRGDEGKTFLRRLLRERVGPEVEAGPKRGFSIPLKRLVREEGLFASRDEIDVFGAFRIRREDVERTLGPRRDSHRLWLLDCLARFVEAHERGT